MLDARNFKEYTKICQKSIYKIWNYGIINIGNGEATKVVCQLLCKKHIEPSSYRCVFLLVYCCLLIIITKAIIKANVMIVTETKPAKSNFIVKTIVLFINPLLSFQF